VGRRNQEAESALEFSMRTVRWIVGGALMLVSQLAQWFCLLMMAVTLLIIGHALFSTKWGLLGTALLALVLWGLGALVSSAVHHWSGYLLPD
jgi:hypothetical protein